MLSKLLRSSLLLLVVWAPTLAMAELKPKMLQKEPATEPLGPPADIPEPISARTAVFMGDCEPTFQFPLSGGDGRGVIGVTSPDIAEGCAIEASTGAIEADMQKLVTDFVGIGTSTEGLVGIPFTFKDVNGEGGTATVTCSSHTEITVILTDDSKVTLGATIKEEEDGDLWELDAEDSDVVLHGQTTKGNSPISFSNANRHSIKVKHSQGQGKGLALVQVKVKDSKGNSVLRTLVKEAKDKQNVQSVNVKCCDISADGKEVSMSFPGLGKQDELLKVEARLGLRVNEEVTPIAAVDVGSMLNSKNEDLVVHGDWISYALKAHDLESNSDFEIVVMDVSVTDPNDSYRKVGKLGNVIYNMKNNHRRHLLLAAARAADDGPQEITEEMRVGRKPESVRRHLRSLSSVTHKKILVHGYCSEGNPFPIDHFTDAVVFSSPNSDGSLNNWSHDVFAQKIDAFADAQGIHGCACIAHSQGGAACTHMYTYYWSCLDNAEYGGSRLIQSVGTPYQGTPLAGNLAAIGDVFGAGCGTNNDLSTSGAASWLAGIPSWAKAQVHYFTTSFAFTNWWTNDYCNFVTDLILDDPEDGTTEKDLGQLPGGNNRGHKVGWCHTDGMTDPNQATDAARNVEMNLHAKY